MFELISALFHKASVLEVVVNHITSTSSSECVLDNTLLSDLTDDLEETCTEMHRAIGVRSGYRIAAFKESNHYYMQVEGVLRGAWAILLADAYPKG